MQFLAGPMLWWLVPLAGIIILLYLLKMRRRDVRVPAVFLWPRLTADVRANAPIQKLRVSLLLVLQILAVLLIVLGMAQPVRRALGLSGHATVIVLDSSASMGATDLAPTRFDYARRRVAALIGSLGAGDRVALISAGALTRVVFPLSSDKPKMMATLASLTATDSPGDMGEALRLAAALVGQEPGSRIIVLSDGDFPPVADFSAGRAQVVYETIGKSARNLGITALDSAPLPNGTQQLFAAIHNYDSAPMLGTVTFTVDSQIADSRSIDVPAGQTLGETLAIPGAAKKAEVDLTSPGDILAADNHAALYLQGAGTIRTLLVTPGDFFLSRALSLEPSIDLDEAPSVPSFEQADSPGAGRYDLVVFDGVPAVPVKAPAVLSFGGISPDMPVEQTGLANRPRVISWERQDPILQNADLEGMLVQKAQVVRAKPSGRVLVQGTSGPLIVASQANGRRIVYVAWSLLDSDFPLRVSFPIFIDNTVNWLTGQGAVANGGINVHAGQPFSVAVPGNAKTVSLVGPDGKSQQIDVVGGMATVRSADRVGSYLLTGPGLHTQIEANLLDESAGEVAPTPALDIGGRPIAGISHPAIVLAEIWRPLILAGLLVLAFEWWVFVRKS